MASFGAHSMPAMIGCVARLLADGRADGAEEGRELVVLGAPVALERLAGARDDDVEARDHDDQAVVEAPRPVGVAGHVAERAIGVVPPQQAVVSRRLPILLRLDDPQALERLRGGARGVDEPRGQDLLSLPAPAPQVEIAEAGHGVHAGADARAELAARDPVDRVWAVGVVPPGQVRRLDADGREDPLEHQVAEVAAIGEGDALGEPVGAAVAIGPLRAWGEEQLARAAGLGEAGGLGGEVKEGDRVQPFALARAVLGDAEGRVVAAGLVFEALELAVLECDGEGRGAEGLGR